MNHARYLILGASGFIGAHLYAALGPARAVATYHKTPVPGALHFDATRMRLRDSILGGTHNFTHAFLLHGVTNIDQCARDPDLAYAVNVTGHKRVIDDLLAAHIVPVFASSDAVFDGTHGLWTEDG